MASTLAPAGASAAGLTQFEKDRLKRIEENKRRMAADLEGLDVSLLVRQPKPAPVKPKKRKADAFPAELSEKRRSSRISNLPAPKYYLQEEIVVRTPSNRSNSGPGGRRCHGTQAIAAVDGAVDLYLCGKLGWKPECGSASLAAAEAATDAAVALQREIVQQGGAALVKLMSTSQVSGGFWSQVPLDMSPHYGDVKKDIILWCDDKANQDPDTFLYAMPGSSNSWKVVYLPKKDGGGYGLSGGWRGFAIDMRLYPNDTVVYEVLDAPPQTTTDAAAESKRASTDSAAATPSVTIDPNTRMHLRVHVFRASAYEAAVTGKTAATAAAAPSSSSRQERQGSQPLPATPEPAEPQQREGTQPCRSGTAEGSTVAAAIPAAAAAAEDTADNALLDMPLTKRAKRAAAGDWTAAAAGLVSGTKVARQPGSASKKCSSIEGEERCGGGGQQQQQQLEQKPVVKRSRKSTPPPPAAKAAVRKSPKSATAGAGRSSKKLVPKPANPTELVQAPTADEQRRGYGKGPFPVKEIVAHRVNPDTSADEFLVSWVGFGSYWDSWEKLSSLNHKPGEYPWKGGKAAVPKKFRL